MLTEKKKHNLVNHLGLTLDKDRIIRRVCRVGAAQLTEGVRAPILLPKKNHVTDLLTKENHCTLACHRLFSWFAKHNGFYKDLRKSEEFCGNAKYARDMKVDLTECLKCRLCKGRE